MEKFAWNKKCENLPKKRKFHEEIAKIFVENEENFASAGNPSFNIVSDQCERNFLCFIYFNLTQLSIYNSGYKTSIINKANNKTSMIQKLDCYKKIE